MVFVADVVDDQANNDDENNGCYKRAYDISDVVSCRVRVGKRRRNHFRQISFCVCSSLANIHSRVDGRLGRAHL